MKREMYWRMLAFLRPYVWPYFVGAMLCMISFSATNGVMPFLVRGIFDQVFGEKNPAALRTIPLIIIVTFAVRGLFAYGSVYLTDYVGHRIIADVRSAVNDRLQRLSLSFFNRTPTGGIISRVTNDVALMRAAVTDAFAAVLKDATSLLVLIGVAFYLDWFLALIAFIAFPASVLPVIRLSRRVRRATTKGQAAIGNLTVLLQETSQGNRVVKAFGMEEYERRRFDRENDRLFRMSMKATSVRAATNPIMEVLAAFGIAGVVLYGGHSVLSGGRTQGEFMGFLTALLLLYEPFKTLARTNNLIQQGLAAAERVFEILDTQTDVLERPHARAFTGMREDVRLEDVSFRYDREPVLENVSLRIGRGEIVALVGSSGAGKSTIADLIPRFYDVAAGRILIDGVDIREYTLESLRAHIGIVTQHTFLFNDTIRNNIAYGSIDRDMDAIIAAARAAYAHDFIAELPDAYETVVGEMGMLLSGGQRQRLAIARALLKDPPILLLDEATSALDNESERLVQAALERLMAERTTLVIAHRLSTVRRADRIVVLGRGRVVEQGTHEELLELNAEYRRLHDLEFRDREAAAAPLSKILH